MTWYLLAGLTALLASLKDLTCKRATERVDPWLIAWAWTGCALPFLLPLLWWIDTPPLGPHFWPAFGASVVINVVSLLLYIEALRASDLSLSLPILAFTPAFMLLTSPLIVGESPSGTGLLGVALVVAGSYLLNARAKGGLLAPFQALFRERGPRLMLAIALVWSISSNTDKVAVLNSSPLFYAVAAYSAIALLMAPLALYQVRRPFAQLAANAPQLLLIGVLSAGEVVSQMLAIQHLLAPYVIAIKRTSTLLGVVWGGLLLREEGMRERLTGSAVMLAGAALITLA